MPSLETPPRGRALRTWKPGDRALSLRNASGIHEIPTRGGSEACAPGDWVEVVSGQVRRLTPNRRGGRTAWMDRVLDPRRVRGTGVRRRVERGIRDFFDGRGFIETRTPLLVPCPGMEPHIRPMSVGSAGSFLPTSPEFAMKRLLAGGLERIYQICPAFRAEPLSVTHHPEFTMLEWYRAFAGYDEIMRDTEELVAALAIGLHGRAEIPYQGRNISVSTPWPRLKVADLFREHAGVDLREPDLAPHARRLGLGASTEDTWDDLYFKIWLNLIEPRLPADRAVFVLDYPPSQAALSVLRTDPDGSRWAKRFEFYIGGLELGNAFEELTDPAEQRTRFIRDMELRAEIYGAGFPKSPLDEGFLEALEEGMPPSGGIAVGVDRLVMLLADETDIRNTVWLESYFPGV